MWYNVGSKRMFMTTIAVRPCTDVNPAALLRSLLALAGSLRSHSAAVTAALRRPAADLGRLTTLLLLFIRHLGEQQRDLPGSAVSALSELHLALQTLCSLMGDVGRDGARVWVLFHCREIAGELRRLVQSAAEALGRFPATEVVLDDEVVEILELFKRQAGRGRMMEVDIADEEARDDVTTAMYSFQNQIIPDSKTLSRVFDHLKIYLWRQCDQEIKFLEQELCLVIEEIKSTGTERTEQLLLSFMSYCRVVIFFDDYHPLYNMKKRESGNHVREKDEKLMELIRNSEDFRCPISLEPMVDPVVIETGHTYDRSSIEKWFNNGNSTCPNTGKKLADTQLVPNLSVHGLIQRLSKEDKSHRWHESAQKCFSLSSSSEGIVIAARALAVFLIEKLWSESEVEKSKAVFEIRVLTQQNTLHRACLIEAGSILLLLDMILSSSCASIDQNNAMASLLHLANDSKGKAMIVESGGLEPILSVLINGVTMEGRENAAATLFYLASVDEYRGVIGEMPEAVPGLAGLLTSGGHRGKKYALVALYGLLLCHPNHARVLQAGILPYLINLLLTEHGELLDCALMVVATLAERRKGAFEILEAVELQRLVGHLQSSSSPAGNESYLSLLLSLCIHGGMGVVGVLRDTLGIMASLYSLLAGGSPRAVKKARALLNLLHEWSNSSSMQCLHQPVHVHAQ